MYRLMLAAMGAMVLWALTGCAMHRDAGVSAMARMDDARPGVVTVELSEILRP